MAGPRRCVRSGPEHTGVAIVHLHNTRFRWIERRDHSRVEAESDAQRISRCHVCHAAANLAALKCDALVAPCVRVGQGRAGLTEQLGLILAVEVTPERTVATAERAIAIEYPGWGLGDLEANGGAVTSGFDHAVILR